MTELVNVRTVPAEPSATPFRALERGAWHGAWTVAVGTTPSALAYLARWHHLDMPWATIGVQLATFAPLCGAFYGAGIALGLAVSKQCGRLHSVAAITLAALGAAVGGIAPGAFAAWHFGSIAAPYFGTFEILAAGVLAFSLFGVAMLRADGASIRRAAASLALALVPVAALGGAAALFLPDLVRFADGLVLESAYVVNDLLVFGAAFGAIVGLLFGALLGLAATLARRGRR